MFFFKTTRTVDRIKAELEYEIEQRKKLQLDFWKLEQRHELLLLKLNLIEKFNPPTYVLEDTK